MSILHDLRTRRLLPSSVVSRLSIRISGVDEPFDDVELAPAMCHRQPTDDDVADHREDDGEQEVADQQSEGGVGHNAEATVGGFGRFRPEDPAPDPIAADVHHRLDRGVQHHDRGEDGNPVDPIEDGDQATKTSRPSPNVGSVVRNTPRPKLAPTSWGVWSSANAVSNSARTRSR